MIIVYLFLALIGILVLIGVGAILLPVLTFIFGSGTLDVAFMKVLDKFRGKESLF